MSTLVSISLVLGKDTLNFHDDSTTAIVLATYSSGDVIDVTNDVTFTQSPAEKVSITYTPKIWTSSESWTASDPWENTASVTPLAAGTTTVTATFGGQTATGNITVNQASDASVSVTLASNAGTYGTAATLVTAANSSSHGTSEAKIGYKYGSAATADSQITWVNAGLALSLAASASAGTYYIYKKWTADSNHSNSATYTQVGTLSRSKTTGSSGTVSNPDSQTYKTSGTYSFTIGITGATGTVAYPSSITVKQGNTSITGWTISDTTVIVPTGTNAGSYSVTGNITVAATTNYNAVGSTSKTWTVTINKANGNVGSVSNPASQEYKANNTTYSFQLGMTGNTGTVTYPTSITVKNSGNTTVSGWSCTSAGVVTVPAGTNAGSYTVTGNVTCAASTNYNAVTTGQSKSWTITITKATPTFALLGNVSTPETDETSQSGIEYHGTAYIEARASVVGTIYWGTSSSSMTQTVSVTAASTSSYNTTVTTRTELGTTTIYAYFKPTDTTNYNDVGSSSSPAASSAAKIIQSPDDDLEITVTGGTYTGNQIVIATVDSYEGVLITNNVPQYTLGYTVGSTSGTITWGSVGVNTISVTNAGTYYIHYKLTPDANHSTTHTDTILSNEPAVIEKADNPLTITSPSTTSSNRKTLYYNSEAPGYSKVQINTSGAVGTVTYSSGNTSRATVSDTGLVEYVSDGNVNITVTASGNSNYKSKSLTVYITCATDSVVSYGDVYVYGPGSAPISKIGSSYTMDPGNVSSYPFISQERIYASGRSDAINTYNWSEAYGKFTITYSAPTTTGFSMTTTSSTSSAPATCTVTAENNNTTSERSYPVTVSVTGQGSKSASKTITFTQSAGSKVYDTPVIKTYTYASFAAAGATKTPNSVTYEQDWTWNGVAGSRDGNKVISGGTLAYSTTGTLPTGFSTGSNFATTGSVTWAGRGTTLGNARSAKSNLLVKVTLNGISSSNYTCTACDQVGNYVTAITPRASNGTAHFTYNNITAGATSASPTLTGAATYTYSSGSTSTSAPSSGTPTYTRTYSLGTVQNGFTAVNSSSGVLTATNRGTTPGAARTSGTVTSVLTVTYVHSSTYSAGGTVTSSTMTSTATCTQGANALTGITFTVTSSTISYNGSTTGTVNATYTSGSSKNVSNDTNTSYTDDGDPDIVSFTKNS